MTSQLNPAFVKMLADPKNALAFQNLLDTAARIVADFDNHGEVLQSNEDGRYDETTDIEKLRGAISKLDPEMVSSGDYAPWLTEEQQIKLLYVAAEVVAVGDGAEHTHHIDDAIAEVETMLPRERIEATGYYASTEGRQEQLRKRLGFDPDTGEEVQKN